MAAMRTLRRKLVSATLNCAALAAIGGCACPDCLSIQRLQMLIEDHDKIRHQREIEQQSRLRQNEINWAQNPPPVRT